jgi:thiamine-monophosphate kinase
VADEFARIARIARTLSTVPRGREIETGIGDDAAVLRADGALVWTIDQQVEGVHFRRDLLRDDDLGYRATVAAVSDVLAMGATPVAALAAWTLPEGVDEATIDAIAQGQRAACLALACPIVGGNLARGPALSIATTALGRVPQGARAIGRDGARDGDRLVVAGAVGEAALGLAALLAGLGDDREAARFVAAWRRPPTRLEEAAALAPIARAMVDVSDGLAQDAGHLAAASGLGVVLDETAIDALVDDAFRALAARLGLEARHLVLAGGEDYALVAAVAPDARLGEGMRAIGTLTVGEGVRVRARDGALRDAPAGFRHST